MKLGLIDNPVHELDFDGIDLTGRTDYGGLRFRAFGEGSTLGNPVPINRTITTALLDGSYVVTDRFENREPAFQLRIEADNHALLDMGQAMLFRSCSRQVILGWKPPDGWGDRRVYRAFTSELFHAFDDMDELRLVRAFNLKLICDPWAYGDEVTTVAGVQAPPTPTTVVISDGTSAVGWSSPATAAAQPASSGGVLVVAVRTEHPASAPYYLYESEATDTFAAVDFSVTPYVSVDVKAAAVMQLAQIVETTNANSTSIKGYGAPSFNANSQFGNADPRGWAACYVDGVQLSLVTFTTLADGTVRYTWRSDDPSATTLRVVAGTRRRNLYERPVTYPAGTAAGITIDNVQRSNVTPGQSSTGRASERILVAGGSARTTASIAIEHPTAGLGEVIYYSSSVLGAGGYQPSLRRFLVASSAVTSADSSTISGSVTTLTTAVGSNVITFEVPVTQLPPGPYLFLTRVQRVGSSVATLTAKVSQVQGSAIFGETTFLNVLTPVLTNPALDTLGVVHLPPQAAPRGASSTVRLTFTMSGLSGTTMTVDDVWAFYLGDGADITRVTCGSGTASLGTIHNRLFIEQPTPLRPRPGLYVGTTADRTDSVNPGYPTVSSRGIHPILPGSNQIYVITTGAGYPTITFRHTPASF